MKKILKGVRILSLALNLPGPAAIWRCRQMGAHCTKLEPPAPAGMPPGTPGDPMGWAGRATYDLLHEGIRVVNANAKTDAGQKIIHRELAKASVLVTSFRPSALAKLGLDWKALNKKHPHLSQVAIVGATADRAEEPGHDLTYMAANGLVQGLNLPPTLYADMGGSLMASEAIVKAVLLQKTSSSGGKKTVKGAYFEVALADASHYLGLPLAWGMTRLPGTNGKSDLGGPVGGGHAGYKVYASKDGRVALAALEPHFAKSLCDLAGVSYQSAATMYGAPTHVAVTAFLLSKTNHQLMQLAVAHDLPLHTMAK